MVLRHFHLREQPFGVTPDPRFLFASETHREALAALLYGVESGCGFITMTANPGMGKTTLLFEALRRLEGTTKTVFLFQAIASPMELVRALLIDLGVEDPQGSLVDLQTQLNEILVKQSESGQRLVVVLDEAQNMDESVLEAVRMLSNFETASHKLMQIILCGQLQLSDKLALPQLLQLRQRISIFAYLKTLSVEETSHYIDHRLKVAGYNLDRPLFSGGAVNLIARQSGGVPRNINNICFNALSLACAVKKNIVDEAVIREVVADLEVKPEARMEHITVGETQPARRLERLTVLEAHPAEPEAEASGGGRGSWQKIRVAAIAAGIALAALGLGRVLLFDSHAFRSDSTVQARTAPAASTAATAQPEAPTYTSASTRVPLPAQVQHAVQAPVRTPIQAPPPAPAPAAAVPAPSVPATHAAAPQAVATVHDPAPTPVNLETLVDPATAAPAPAPVTTAVPAGVGMQLVRVRRGQSLSTICTETYGSCESAVLNRIIQLNPQISDPDHIKSGQTVALPVTAPGQTENN